jgi:hypothetical protein
MGRGNFELADVGGQPSLTGIFEINQQHGWHDHVSLQDVESDSMFPREHVVTTFWRNYGCNASYEYGEIETLTHDLDTMDSKIVPQSSQSPSTRSHHRGHGPNGDGRHTRGHIHFRPNAVIKDWYLKHSSSLYPPPDQITALATLSGRSEHQVKICLSNLRARTKTGEYIYLCMGTIII